MRRMTSILSVAAVFTTASALTAQKPAPRNEPPPARSDDLKGTRCFNTNESRTECNIFRRSSMDSAMMKRAALGLQLSSTGTVRDTIGVFVTRVTPKGPAENAGIVEGDRIVSMNGTDLRVSAADAGDSYAGALPTRRLTRAVDKLSPGTVVTLRVSSGGRIHDVQVTAGRASDLPEGPFGMMMGMAGMDGMMRSMPRMNMGDLHGIQPESFQRMKMEEFPRMRMEEFPRMRMESMPRMNPEDMKRMHEDMQRMKQDMPMLRERMQELPMRLREMEMAPMRMRLRDSVSYKTFGPSGGVYIYRDSASRKSRTYDSRTKAEKAAAERAASSKAKQLKEKEEKAKDKN